MVKRDPDDLITALSKNLKTKNAPNLRFTLKRGGLWQPNYAKAHSRIAKRQIKNQIKAESVKKEENISPLLVRYRENFKEGKQRLNALIKIDKGVAFMESILNVFRVNFFKKKDAEGEKVLKIPTKPNPNSNTTKKKKMKTIQNRTRRHKRLQIRKQQKKDKNVKKQK